jgi:hypothetical protein
VRLIIKSNFNLYETQVPNYADERMKEKILENVKWALPENETIEHHMFHSDSITDYERKQLDIYGEIKTPFTQLTLEN